MGERIFNEAVSVMYKAPKKTILCILASRSSDDLGGLVFIKRSEIARMVGCCERTVIRYTNQLIKEGVLVVHKPASHHSPPTYRVIPRRSPKFKESHLDENMREKEEMDG